MPGSSLHVFDGKPRKDMLTPKGRGIHVGVAQYAASMSARTNGSSWQPKNQNDTALRRHVGRTMTEAETNRPWQRWIAIGIAIVGGLIAAGGYFWVAEVAAADSNPFESPQWYRFSTGPGMAAFVAGSVLLVSALVVIRRQVRSHSDGRIVWASVWPGWLAIALTCFGTELNADVDSGIGAETFWLGLLVGVFAIMMLIIGVGFFAVRRRGRQSHR